MPPFQSAIWHDGGWFRIFGWGLQWTRSPPYYSERAGLRSPFLRLAGWRFFFLQPKD